jgi:hypothetical protein
MGWLAVGLCACVSGGLSGSVCLSGGECDCMVDCVPAWLPAVVSVAPVSSAGLAASLSVFIWTGVCLGF